MPAVTIDGHSLTIEEVVAVARLGARAKLGAAALGRMNRSRAVVERAIAKGAPVYGVNTGFGHLADVRIAPADLEALQLNLVRSHASGVGPPLEADAVRAMMLLRANVLAKGLSGVRPVIVRTLLAMLRAGLVPRIPSQGSVGASGDLAPLAHLALCLVGEGEVLVGTRRAPSGTAHRAPSEAGPRAPSGPALRAARIPALRLGAKEGLALVNGTQFMTAIGALALADAESLARHADLAGAMSLESLRGSVKPMDERIHAARPHAGQRVSAGNLRRLLRESEIMDSHRNCGRIQDSYALRCMPQVHGAARGAFAHVREVLAVEINAATDNPLVFTVPRAELVSGGNFHGQPVAAALDYLATAVTSLASISERRIDRLVNPYLSELPAFLAENVGLNSGFMLAQVTAAALVSENKVLAHPASVDSIPTSANKEDHVSMGSIAARKAASAVRNAQAVVAIELLAASQALDFLKPLRPAKAVGAAHRAVRRRVPHMARDRILATDIETIIAMIESGEILRAAERVSGRIV